MTTTRLGTRNLGKKALIDHKLIDPIRAYVRA